MRPRGGGSWIIAWAVAALVAGIALTGCAARSFDPLPLRPEPIAYADTLPIPEPEERAERRKLRALLVHGPLQLAEPFDPGEGESLNLTHDDDVVSSAWWERRVGYRRITPEDLALGPTSAENAPATSGPLEIKSVKTDGVTPGFTMKDANGHTYIVKPGLMHLTSAAGVIGNRLMWGMGCHVPEDYVTEFDFSRLVVDEDATIEELGVERPLTIEDLRTLLERTEPIEGERYLAFASLYLPGVPKGPFFFEGRRDDDPNDYFDHQHRRELRALWVFSSWINNTDMREGNTLDVYVNPGYLRHYLIDFGATMGSSSTRPKHRKDETERPIDLYRFIGRIATLDLYKQPWEDHPVEPLGPALGFMHGEGFDPDSWKSSWTNPAFQDMTDADSYWAAKILAAFTDEQIRGAVGAGGFSDHRSVDTLTALLRLRRDRIVEYYYERVSTVGEPIVAR